MYRRHTPCEDTRKGNSGSICEAMETRRLFAAPIYIYGSGFADTIHVTTVNDQTMSVDMNGTVTQYYVPTDTLMIYLDAGGGDDQVLFEYSPPVNTPVYIYGGAGNDGIYKTADHNTTSIWEDKLYGQTGNDTLASAHGSDYLDGGDDTDTVDYSARTARVYVYLDGRDSGETLEYDRIASCENVIGGAGSDIIYGDASSNIIDARDGADFVYGGDGADSITGGNGADMISGDAGNDSLAAGQGNDTLVGGVGSDLYSFTDTTTSTTYTVVESWEAATTDTLDFSAVTSGGIVANLASNTGFAGYANTTINGDGTANTIANIEKMVGSAGNDSVNCSTATQSLTLVGGNGDDTLKGGDGIDTILGGNGNDSLVGANNHDSLMGEAGNDTLVSGPGNDTLEGGDGSDLYTLKDRVTATVYMIVESAGSGTDTLDFSSLTSSAVSANLSANTAFASYANVTIDGSATLNTVANIESIIGGPLADNISGGTATQNLTLVGGAGNDTLKGGDGIDTIYGGVGNDSLLGANNNDSVMGETGNDTLAAGPGNDTLNGGAGSDIYTFKDRTAVSVFTIFEGSDAGSVDTLDFSGVLNSGIVANLTTNAAMASYTNATVNGDSGSNTAANIEKAIGGAQADDLTGNGLGTNLVGGAGNDVFHVRNGVSDTITGGDGTDTAHIDDGALDSTTDVEVLLRY